MIFSPTDWNSLIWKLQFFSLTSYRNTQFFIWDHLPKFAGFFFIMLKFTEFLHLSDKICDSFSVIVCQNSLFSRRSFAKIIGLFCRSFDEICDFWWSFPKIYYFFSVYLPKFMIFFSYDHSWKFAIFSAIVCQNSLFFSEIICQNSWFFFFVVVYWNSQIFQRLFDITLEFILQSSHKSGN